MKKLLLVFSLFGAYIAEAQVCTPGTVTAPANAYILPDSATNLDHGCAGFPYTQTMYLKAAKDTTINVTTGFGNLTLTADIDSFVVDANIGGLPAYLSVASEPVALPPSGGSSKTNYTRLVIPGDSLACVKISGLIPTGTASGTNNLTIGLRVYTSNITCINPATIDPLIPTLYPGRKTDTVTTLTYYSFVVDPIPCYPQAVSNLEQYGFELVGNIPNPGQDYTRIAFQSNQSKNYELSIRNTMGQVVYQKQVKAQPGINYINMDTHAWVSGQYIYSISNGQQQLTKNMLIQH